MRWVEGLAIAGVVALGLYGLAWVMTQARRECEDAGGRWTHTIKGDAFCQEPAAPSADAGAR